MLDDAIDPAQEAALMSALVGANARPVRAILDVRAGRPLVVYAALVVRPDAVDPLVALMHGMDVPTMTGGSAVPAADLGGERDAVVALLAEMEDDAGVMEESGDKRGQTVRGYAGRLRHALGMERREVNDDA